MDLELKGRKALVTGGTRGIGRAIVEELAAEGCDVAFCARHEDQVRAAETEVAKHGVRALGAVVDVGEADALREWIDGAAEALGGLDVVVANVSALAAENTAESWRRSFEVDIMATVNTVEASLPWVLESDAGSLVAISSVSGVSAGAPPNSYNAVKSAIITFMAMQAVHLAPRGVRANTVSPGTIFFEDGHWGRVKRETPEAFERVLARNPMGRMGTPREVAAAVAFLVSARASFITGANLCVDGAVTRRVQF